MDEWEELLAVLNRRPLKEGHIKIDKDSGELVLESERFSLTVTINQKWIGYDFLLKKHVLGVEMSSWVDTDNYALDFNSEATKDIYKEVKRFVDSLVSNKIYYGKLDGRPVLAWPQSKKEYFVSFAPKLHFFTKNDVVPEDMILNNKNLSQLEVV